MSRGRDPGEVLIIGGGTMGCAAAWALARGGVRVRVLERFEHVHGRGSHGGFTRVIRHAYHEGADYVQLVERADQLWGELEARVAERLLVRCGLLEFGPPDDPEFVAATEALELHGVEHERLGPEELRTRFPFVLPADWTGTFSPRSGYLRVGPCLDALRAEAVAAGAVFEYGVRVRELVRGPTLGALLDDGRVIAADHLVVAVGAFAGQLLPGLFGAGHAAAVQARRKVLGWTEPERAEARASLAELPVWAAFVPEGFFYGFPYGEEGTLGFKLACHALRGADVGIDGPRVDPEAVDPEVSAAELAPLERFMDAYLPRARGPFVDARVCLYGQSEDGDFIVDRWTEDPRVSLCVGFSGHGFKFAPAIGEAVAQLVIEGRSTLTLDRFRLARFAE